MHWGVLDIHQPAGTYTLGVRHSSRESGHMSHQETHRRRSLREAGKRSLPALVGVREGWCRRKIMSPCSKSCACTSFFFVVLVRPRVCGDWSASWIQLREVDTEWKSSRTLMKLETGPKMEMLRACERRPRHVKSTVPDQSADVRVRSGAAPARGHSCHCDKLG